MRKFQKATAVIMAAALAATGCSAGGTKTSAPQQPSGTEAAKTDAAAGADNGYIVRKLKGHAGSMGTVL